MSAPASVIRARVVGGRRRTAVVSRSISWATRTTSTSLSKPIPVSSRLARKVPSISPTVGEVLHAGEAEVSQPGEEALGVHERVGAVDPGQHRGVAHHGEHLVGHLDDDVVGVAVGQQPGQRAVSGHPVATGVVDHDQVDPRPASSHLAEMPVPAPPPIRGTPLSILARNRSSSSALVKRRRIAHSGSPVSSR